MSEEIIPDVEITSDVLVAEAAEIAAQAIALEAEVLVSHLISSLL